MWRRSLAQYLNEGEILIALLTTSEDRLVCIILCICLVLTSHKLDRLEAHHGLAAFLVMCGSALRTDSALGAAHNTSLAVGVSLML